jgi:hypothetical protein
VNCTPGDHADHLPLKGLRLPGYELKESGPATLSMLFGGSSPFDDDLLPFAEELAFALKSGRLNATGVSSIQQTRMSISRSAWISPSRQTRPRISKFARIGPVADIEPGRPDVIHAQIEVDDE